MDEYYKDKRFFDFGISNEFNGRAINHGLLHWKEGFGGRSYAHNFYEVCSDNYVKLEPVLSTRLYNLLNHPAQNIAVAVRA